MSVDTKDLIESVTSLISFPAVATQLNEMANDGHSDAAAFGRVIQNDPALTASLLRLANSSFYRFAAPIDSVNNAVTRVGINQVRDLALGICTKRAFEGIPNRLISMHDFWKHSLYCAIAARELAQEVGLRPKEALFTAGLLHDIGQLVLFHMRPEQSTEALIMCVDDSDGREMHIAESDVFGFDHAQVGAQLARHWNLPEVLVQCIAHHHTPHLAEEFEKHVAVIHIANTVSVTVELDSDDIDDGPAIDSGAWATLNSSPDVLPGLLEKIKEEFADMEKLVLGDLRKSA